MCSTSFCVCIQCIYTLDWLCVSSLCAYLLVVPQIFRKVMAVTHFRVVHYPLDHSLGLSHHHVSFSFSYENCALLCFSKASHTKPCCINFMLFPVCQIYLLLAWIIFHPVPELIIFWIFHHRVSLFHVEHFMYLVIEHKHNIYQIKNNWIQKQNIAIFC